MFNLSKHGAVASVLFFMVSCEKPPHHKEYNLPIVHTALSSGKMSSLDVRATSKGYGTFKIYTTTFLCFGKAEFSDEHIYKSKSNRFFSQNTKLLTLFPDLMKVKDGNFENRLTTDIPGDCFGNSRNIWIGGRIERNRFGGRHRVTLIARQGDSWWQGSFERYQGGGNLNHKINPKNDDSENNYVDGEKMIATDLNMLGREFYLHLARTAKFI
jgi:hypothetical protein